MADVMTPEYVKPTAIVLLASRMSPRLRTGTFGGMSASVDLVIFDCDGVLVDSERLAVRIEARLITALGWPLTEDDVLARFVGRSDAYMLDEIEVNLGRAVPDWQERYETQLHQAFRDELAAVEGIERALDDLAVPTCVASSGTHEKMQLTLGLTGLYERFDGRIFSATEVANGKPAPDLFLHAAARTGVPPERCIVVEDSRSGVQAARAANMRALGYAGGLTPASWLEGPQTVVFDDMAVLSGLIHSLTSIR
jgi:HAD superfamily hydrolase (TIGR01509 family)